MSKPHKVKHVSAGNPIGETATRILRTRLREFYSHWPDPQQSPSFEQLHNLRISGKRLRYSAEQLRQLYPDRLALLIDLLKRGQDLLGLIQDCVTQNSVIENELSRLKRRQSGSKTITALEKLLENNEQRKAQLFLQFREIWMGMATKQFRKGLKAMVSINSFSKSSSEHPQPKKNGAGGF